MRRLPFVRTGWPDLPVCQCNASVEGAAQNKTVHPQGAGSVLPEIALTSLAPDALLLQTGRCGRQMVRALRLRRKPNTCPIFEPRIALLICSSFNTPYNRRECLEAMVGKKYEAFIARFNIDASLHSS